VPRWPDRSEHMEALAKLIISLQDEDRAPSLEEVMAATGVRTKRLAAQLLRDAGTGPSRRGRPWPAHAEYMGDVHDLARKRAARGGSITAAEIQEKLNVGPDLAAALLANLGLTAPQYPEDDELLPQARAIIEELGDHWSENELVKRLHIHHRRAKRLAIALGKRPEEIKRGQSAAGNAWWTGKANMARHGKREETN
jgi:hypothetical protein